MKTLELHGSTHRAHKHDYWHRMYGRDYSTHCDICARPTGLHLYQRTRRGAYIFPEVELGDLLEFVCKRCYDCNYGFIYEVKCLTCETTHARNQRCDGPYTCVTRCVTCDRETLHERTDLHMADNQ